jgi:dihydrofolate synthase/folylpolyglutamate synthase
VKTPFEIYEAANARLDALIDTAPVLDRSLPAITARAEERLVRTSRFLAYLGNPHHSAPVIHVAGTSGKGSTATTVAHILRSAGFRTLLHTSPYLQVATEKLAIDGRLIEAASFAGLVDTVLAEMDEWGQARLTYGEAWMALIGLAMAMYRPDIAVIEVGAGGRFDLTNLVRSQVAVISSIGIDHTETLGSTIEQIAWHKAGIIKPGSRVIHAVDDPVAVSAIEREARESGVIIAPPVLAGSLVLERERDDRWSWRDPATGERLMAGLPGMIQAQNSALAVAAARAWNAKLSLDDVRTGLASTRFPARFERMPDARTVILDGAHNPQKVAALAHEINRLPHPRIGVLGFLAAKRADEMLNLLAPHLDEIVLTAPDVIGKPGLDADRAVALARTHTAEPVTGEVDPFAALDSALVRAGDDGSVLVAGSLYLCGAIRERWYSSAEIVAQQTAWPERKAPARS